MYDLKWPKNLFTQNCTLNININKKSYIHQDDTGAQKEFVHWVMWLQNQGYF